LTHRRRLGIKGEVKAKYRPRVCLNGEVKMPSFKRTLLYRSPDHGFPGISNVARIDYPLE
jgi:hypothetical protein